MLFLFRFILNITWLVEHFSFNAKGANHFSVTLALHKKIIKFTSAKVGKKLQIKIYDKPITKLRFFYHYFSATPFVVKNMANNWPAISKWDLDFFYKTYPNTKIPFLDTMVKEDSTYQEETIKTVIDSFNTGIKKYCKFSNLLYVLPELQKDLKYEELNKYKPIFHEKGTLQFFLGPSETQTRLHCAPGHNFFIQVFGKKNWYIYPTKYNQLFLPLISDSAHFISDPRFDFPHVEETVKNSLDHWVAELSPGDFLYNPSFLWHTVHNPTDSIAVKSSWVSPNSFLYNPTFGLISLRALGLNIFKIRKAFNSGIFFPKRWF